MSSFRRMLLAAGLIALAVAVALLAAGCTSDKGDAARYHCPMHPAYISDRPGDCPICGMRLVRIEEGAPAAMEAPAQAGGGNREHPDRADRGPQLYQCPMHPGVTSRNPEDRCPRCSMKINQPIATAAAPAQDAPEGGGRVLFYRNPMNPQVTSPVPMKDEMGMDYVPVYADEARPAVDGASPPGYATIQLQTEGIQLAGVQTSPAVRTSIGRAVRAVGTIKADERLVRHVHTKIPGWIEKLFVNFTGQPVRRGQPILSIYSQEILAGQEEFLRARAAATRFSGSSLPEVRDGAEDLMRAARRRLELLDVPPSFVDELERRGTPQRAVTLLSPASGFVTTKDIFEGQQVEPGMELYTVTDLSRVWVEADIYEFEAAAIRLGQPAHITSPYESDLSLDGRVNFIYPYLKPETRTLQVRFEFPNPTLALKPDMYVNVEMMLEPEAGITIPDSAVIDTGVRQVVFVDRGGGRFEPREVRLGVRGNGRAQVLSGVAEGEQVAVRANFLLDSESRLRAAIAGSGAAGSQQQ